MKQRMKQKLNNAGYTLVEVVIAVAIFSILSIAITGFIATVNNNFRKSQIEVELQYEAQVVNNQLRDIMIDTSKGMTVKSSTGVTDIFVYEQSDYYRVTWLSSTHSLYLKYYVSGMNAEEPLDVDSADLISDMVYSFDIDTSAAQSRRQLYFQILIAKDDTLKYQYDASNTITLRNNIQINKTLDQLYPTP